MVLDQFQCAVLHFLAVWVSSSRFLSFLPHHNNRHASRWFHYVNCEFVCMWCHVMGRFLIQGVLFFAVTLSVSEMGSGSIMTLTITAV